mmetsp:Transcript_433/g.510  ORF Transcript_433/g.510 Transcript_433/m.510 type:complete len:237 (+) Transcript_433:1-711(+)
MSNYKVALIIGATGLTGSQLLRKLLYGSRYSKVISIGRRNMNLDLDALILESLEEHVIDFSRFEDHAHLFSGVCDVFCCLGYGTSPGGFHNVEFVYPSQSAHFAAMHNVEKFIVITGMLSNSKSSFELFRVKGELMDQVKTEDLNYTAFVQPALIVGDRETPRSGEVAMYKCFKWISPVLELIIKKPMYNPAVDIADAMLFIATGDHESGTVAYYDSGDIKRLAHLYRRVLNNPTR